MGNIVEETNKFDVKEALDNAFYKFVSDSLRRHNEMIKKYTK